MHLWIIFFDVTHLLHFPRKERGGGKFLKPRLLKHSFGCHVGAKNIEEKILIKRAQQLRYAPLLFLFRCIHLIFFQRKKKEGAESRLQGSSKASIIENFALPCYFGNRTGSNMWQGD